MKGLKIVLWICAVYCLVGFVFAGLPWPTLTALFEWFGVQPPAPEPVTVYMFRVCLAMSGLVAVFFVMLARSPLKYGAMLLLAAYGLLCYGVFCLVGGIRYALPLWAYSVDVVFGIVAGVLLLIFRKEAMETNVAQ